MLEKFDCPIGTQEEFILKIFGEWILGGLLFARGEFSQSHCLKIEIYRPIFDRILTTDF